MLGMQPAGLWGGPWFSGPGKGGHGITALCMVCCMDDRLLQPVVLTPTAWQARRPFCPQGNRITDWFIKARCAGITRWRMCMCLRGALAGRRPFEFPFAIEGDRINGLTIKLTLNKDARWTKVHALAAAPSCPPSSQRAVRCVRLAAWRLQC